MIDDIDALMTAGQKICIQINFGVSEQIRPTIAQESAGEMLEWETVFYFLLL